MNDNVYKKVSWRIIPFLLICYTLAYLDRVNVSFAKIQMISDLGISETAYGLGAGIFFIGYFIFEVPSNYLLVKIDTVLKDKVFQKKYKLFSILFITQYYSSY